MGKKNSSGTSAPAVAPVVPTMDALDKLKRCRTKLLLDKRFVFWATIGLYQKLVENNNLPMPTMATDGDHVYWDRSFVDSCSEEELIHTLAHEAGHCALGHHLRRGDRDPVGWNIAADFALNQLLEDAGLAMPMKDGKPTGLLDPKWKGQYAEQIYNQIPQITIKKLGGGSCKGYVLDAPSLKGDKDGSQRDKEERRWEVIIRQAAQTAKGQGTLPGHFEYLVEPAKPKLDLNTMLRHLLSTVQEDDYTWAKPNRKYVWQPMYLPSMGTESTGDAVVALDVSGSISKEQAAQFLGVVNLVITDLKPRVLHFIQCDAAVQVHEELKKGELLPTEVGIKGCGGTDMRPIWAYLEEKGIRPTCAIVCSDFCMDKESFGKEQEFPVLWVTTEDGHAPWGMEAKLEIH